MSADDEIDTGVAYGLKPPTYNRDLVEVGPGTPMGELMRRYWQPFFISDRLESDRPRRVRLLGEDLVVFRDKTGKVGLLHERCCHRGSSLFFGRIDDDGIRCCYHGWKFDTKGYCLDQPTEVGGGRNRNRVRQPWYPVQERYGLIYAYMGPPEKKPVLPRWAHLENLAPDETIEVSNERQAGPEEVEFGGYEMNPATYNWLQSYENTAMDAPHVPWLHYNHSGDHFGALFNNEEPPYADIKDFAGRMMYERTELGMRQGFSTRGPDGSDIWLINDAILPNIVTAPPFVPLIYTVPTDDTSYISFSVWRRKIGPPMPRGKESHAGKTWTEMTPLERQLMPGDWESQSSIGVKPAHNHEHLVEGDVPMVMLRRRLEDAVRDVAEGRDPPGVSFDKDAPPVEIIHVGIENRVLVTNP